MKQVSLFIVIVLLVLVGILILVGWYNANQEAEEEAVAEVKVFNIVTSFLPMTIFTQNIAGDVAEVVNLLPLGTGPHEYSLTPSDIQKISKADVLIINGVGLEDWILDAVTGADNDDLETVVASEGIKLIESSHSSKQENEESITEDHDPHIWLSPKNAVTQVKNIAAALIRIDSKNAEVYKQNRDQYIQKLEELDKEISVKLSNVKNKDFVSFHSAFTYFAKDYNLNQVAVIEEFPGKEPSAAYIAEIETQIQDLGIKAIFSEPQFSPRIVEILASDLNLKIYELDPIATGKTTNDYYEIIMNQNADNLVNALNQ